MYKNPLYLINQLQFCKSTSYPKPQQAFTDGVLGGRADIELLAQSCPFLNARAARNRSFHRPLTALFSNEEEDEVAFLQAWSAGKRCLRHTFKWHVLHVLVFENVKTSLHLLTGHVGFFFFLGSQSPDLSCLSKIAFSSSPFWPVVSIDIEHVSHTTTFLLLWSDFGQSWDL